MLNPLVKGLLIFAGGLVVGGGVGATASYFVTKKRLDKEYENAIVELRIHYEELFDKYEPLNTESQEESDISKNEDGLVTVGEGIPTDKKVNTQKLAYDKAYKELCGSKDKGKGYRTHAFVRSRYTEGCGTGSEEGHGLVYIFAWQM